VNDQIGLLEKTSSKNQENIQNLLLKLENIQNNFAVNFELNTSAMKKAMTSSMRNIEKGAENFTANFENMAGPINDLGESIRSMTGLIQAWDASFQKLLSADEAIQDKLQRSSANLNAAQSNFTSIVEGLPNIINNAVASIDNGLINMKQKANKMNLKLTRLGRNLILQHRK
jgi:seryl-tRNA synthetase